MLLASLLTAACSPPTVSITAVFRKDDQPWALFHPCGEALVVGVSLYEMAKDRHLVTATTPGPRPSAAYVEDRSWRIDRGTADGGITELRLLEVPAGWSQQTEERKRITEFVTPYAYDVRADTDKPHLGHDRGITFTLADLTSLDDGEVWAGRNPRAMTRDEFYREAEERC